MRKMVFRWVWKKVKYLRKQKEGPGEEVVFHVILKVLGRRWNANNNQLGKQENSLVMGQSPAQILCAISSSIFFLTTT